MHFTTDPTYLRTINDGLLSGAINKDNASALPMGLVGMYEAAFSLASNVNERGKLLAFFSVWAILRKEVSAEFVVLLLEGWTEEGVIEYIGKYSKWFNSPVSGKYVLYHERFRTFVLQKLSSRQFEERNNAIIHRCQLALKARLNNAWERYALEHLGSHLLINAMESSDGSALKALAYDTAYWNRQIEISKDFEWSKRLLNDMMLWASKYDDDQVIECALNKVDLHHMEQNDAPRIVQLVAENDIETALIRIEAFGGNDKEGLQRKFILYMLCLMELTLLDSKDKPFRKDAIEKLLKHLDDNLPVDHSVLNWNDFFSSYLLFRMSCELDKLGIDYLIVYKRTSDWKKDWIAENGPYSDIQFEILLNCARGISVERKKSGALTAIASVLRIQGQVEESASVIQESLAIAQGIIGRSDNSSAINAISLELSKQGQLDEALAIARGIGDKSEKSSALNAISAELSKQGKMEESESIMQESFIEAGGVSDEYWKGRALKDIAVELSKQAQVVKSLAIARRISYDYWKSIALNDIALEQNKLSLLVESASVMQEALAIAQGIRDESEKSSALNAISAGLSKQDKLEESASLMEESLFVAKEIDSFEQKRIAFNNILVQLTKRGKVKESLAIIQDFGYDWEKNSALKAIALELAKQGQVEESISIGRRINNELEKSMALRRICIEMSEHGRLDVSISLMLELLIKALDFNDGDNINSILKAISTELSLHGRHNESLFIAQSISDNYWKGCALRDLAVHLSKKGLVEESLSIARSIGDELEKCRALSGICIEVSKMGMLELSKSIIKEIHDLSQLIGDFYQNSHAVYEIANSQLKQGLIFESITTAQNIMWNLVKNRVLIEIVAELTIQNRFGEALNVVSDMDVNSKSNALTVIATELSKKGHYEESMLKINESIDITKRIKDERNKSIALLKNAVALKPFRPAESNLLIRESLFVARNISDDRKRSYALRDIAVELSIQGLFALAENVGMEIPLTIERQQCWKKIANKAVDDTSWQKSLEPIALLKSQESQFFYKRGWANAIGIFRVNFECIRDILHFVSDDLETVKKILQKYATQEVALGNPSKELISRLNRTLNIQWLLDITSQFPNHEVGTTRCSTNLDTWLHEIADEDDREQIELWAKQVAKGKITEEEFGERVKAFK